MLKSFLLLSPLAASAVKIQLLSPEGYLHPYGDSSKCIIAGKKRLAAVKCSAPAHADNLVWEHDDDHIWPAKGRRRCLALARKGRLRVGNCGDDEAQFSWSEDFDRLQSGQDQDLCVYHDNKRALLIRPCENRLGWSHPCANFQNEVEDYIHDGPAHLGYEEITNDNYPNTDENGVTQHLILVNSFNYLTEAEVTPSSWKHRVIVMIPPEYDSDIKTNAFFWNDGLFMDLYDEDGNINPITVTAENSGKYARHTLIDEVSNMSKKTGSIGILMYDNPTQRLKWAADPKQQSRDEDGAIAFTWMVALQNPAAWRYNLNLAMTKAVIKTFSAVVDYVEETQGFHLKNYVISGESKRGWTSLLAAALDDRVIGAAPVVFDVFDITDMMRKHFQAIGAWSFVLFPYYVEGVTMHLNDVGQSIYCMADPDAWMHKYKARDVPMHMTTVSGDEFFLIQNGDMTFPRLRAHGIKYDMNTIVNTNHVFIAVPEYNLPKFNAIRIFYYNVARGMWRKTLPHYDYTKTINETHASIQVTFDDDVNDFFVVTMHPWFSDTLIDAFDPEGKKRDFRASRLTPDGNGSFAPGVSGVGFYPGSNLPGLEMDVEAGTVTWPNREGPGYRAVLVNLVFQPKFELGPIFAGRGFAGPFSPVGTDSVLAVSVPAIITPETFGFEDCVEGGDCFGDLRSLDE